jgi:hypothetical protein
VACPKVLDGQDPFDADDIKPALLWPIPDYEIAILALYRTRVSKRPPAPSNAPLTTQERVASMLALRRYLRVSSGFAVKLGSFIASYGLMLDALGVELGRIVVLLPASMSVPRVDEQSHDCGHEQAADHD